MNIKNLPLLLRATHLKLMGYSLLALSSASTFPLINAAEELDEVPDMIVVGERIPKPKKDILTYWIYSSFDVSSLGAMLEGNYGALSNSNREEDEDDCESGGAGGGRTGSSMTAGNPIEIKSGNKVQVERDYVGNGEFPLQVTRRYDSSWGVKSVFGSHWISEFGDSMLFIYDDAEECEINLDDNSGLSDCIEAGQSSQQPIEVWIKRASGIALRFKEDINGEWEPLSDYHKYTLNKSGTEWIVTTDQETIETYNGEGYLQAKTNSLGISHYYTYTDELLTQVSHSSGRTLTFSWSDDKIQEIEDSAGNVYQYGYNGDKLVSVTKPGSPIVNTSYLYESADFPNALTGIEVNDQTFAVFTYHEDGRGESTSHQENGSAASAVEKFELSYTTVFRPNKPNNKTSVTNPLGLTSDYEYEGTNNKLISEERQATTTCPYAAQSTTYDSNNNVDLRIDWNGNTTDFDYNEDGQLLSKTEAVGTAVERVTDYEWKAGEQKLTKQTSADSEVTFDYNSEGRPTIISVKNLTNNGARSEVRTTQFTYKTHSNGILKQRVIDGPRSDVSDVTTFDYDTQGNLTAITNGVGHITLFSNYDALGNVGRMIDPNGLQTDFTYDAAGKVLSVSLNVLGGNVTNYSYNAKGLVTEASLPEGQVINYEYDQAFRLSKVTDKKGNEIRYQYNANSDLTKRTFYGIEASSGGGCTTSNCESLVAKYSETYTYDSLGRVLTQSGNNGQETTSSYDTNSNLVSLTDANREVIQMTYDALNQLKTRTEKDGGTSHFDYDASGRLNSVTDARGLVTNYYYDGFGGLTKQSSPDTGITTWVYNKGGLATRVTTADGKVTTRTFDALGRVSNETQGSIAKIFTYDTGTYRKGRIYTVSDDSGQTTFHYDKQGRIIKKVTTIGTQSFDTRYTYNRLNQMTAIQYPSGQWRHYERDELGQIEGIFHHDFTTATKTTKGKGAAANDKIYVVENVAYLPFGPAESFNFGNGEVRTLNYDMDYRLTQILSGNSQGLIYEYNNQNDIISKTDTRNPQQTQSFDYDNVGRLTRATKDGKDETFAYDLVGNRTRYQLTGSASDTYTYSSSSNQLDRAGSVNISYNQNGHQSQKGAELFTYNTENRLSRYSFQRATTTYQYNAFGQRVKKISPSGTFYYLYSEAGLLIAEHDSSGNVLKEYIYLNGQVVGVYYQGQIYYVHNDHLGRAQAITDSRKRYVWLANNYAFDRAVNTNTIGDYNLGFPGQYYDSEKGSYYNYFRDYDSSTGRYLQSDPIGLAGGMNTYGYVLGNPISLIDPLGLAAGGDTCECHPSRPSADKLAEAKLIYGPLSPSEGIMMTQEDSRETSLNASVVGVGTGYLATALGASNPVSAFIGLSFGGVSYFWPTEGFQAGDAKYELTYEHGNHSFTRFIKMREGKIINSSVALRCNNTH